MSAAQAVLSALAEPLADRLPDGGGLCLDPVACLPDDPQADHIARAVDRPGVLKLVLAAETLWRIDVSGALVDWIVRQGDLPKGADSRIRVVLDEALANALVHGALGLPGLAAFDGDSSAQRVCIEDRLTERARATSPVGIRITRRGDRLFVHVDDWGGGYDFAELPPLDPLSVSGRGLRVILAFATRRRIARGGRRISIAFRLVP